MIIHAYEYSTVENTAVVALNETEILLILSAFNHYIPSIKGALREGVCALLVRQFKDAIDTFKGIG